MKTTDCHPERSAGSHADRLRWSPTTRVATLRSVQRSLAALGMTDMWHRLPSAPGRRGARAEPAERAGSGRSLFRRLRPLAGPLALTAAAYVLIAVVVLQTFDFNPTGPIRIGDPLPGAARFWTDATRVERDGTGYDGQWFYYIAHSPLALPGDPHAYIDLPAYRYARILYPLLVWMAALGRPEWLAWSMLGVNAVAVLAGTAASVWLSRALGASRWLALAYAFSPPVLIGFAACLAEPTAFALVVLGLALAVRGRHGWAGVALAVGTLAREVSLLVPLCFALHALAGRDVRRALAYLLPLALPLAWHAWIWYALGALPALQSPPNFGLPFGGMAYRAGLLLGWQAPLLGELPTDRPPVVELAIIATSAAIMVSGLTVVLRRRDVLAWQLWTQAALALFTGPLVWADLHSYGRVLGLLYLTYGLVVVTGRRPAPAPKLRLADAA